MRNIFLLKRTSIFFLLFLFFSHSEIFSQEKTNLNIFFNLIDSSAASVINNLPPDQKNLSFNFILGSDYDLFKDHLITYFTNKKFKIFQSEKSTDSIMKIDYTIDNAKVTYGNVFRSGFLGTFKVQRNIKISGNYVINKNPIFAVKFNYAVSDTINYGDIKDLEGFSYPVTKGEIPPEPFFSNLLEPVIAIGSAAVVIFLFFTIRSK
jgi:hypothetical protein